MKKTQELTDQIIADKNEAKKIIDALPKEEDYFIRAKRGESKLTDDIEYINYIMAMKEVLNPYLPKFNFPGDPEFITVTTDNTVEPFQTTAKKQDGTVLCVSEGTEGLITLNSKVNEQLKNTIKYYEYDEETLKHTTQDFLFGPRILNSKGEPTNHHLDLALETVLALSYIRTYASWLNLYTLWAEKQDDFYLSYQLIKSHPAMWRNGEKTNTIDVSRGIWLWHEITVDKNNKPVHMFETGSAVEPGRQSHYHDYDLDVYSSTYEEGIITLASLINKKWKWDATPREPQEK